jgi:hypothetical protein
MTTFRLGLFLFKFTSDFKYVETSVKNVLLKLCAPSNVKQ